MPTKAKEKVKQITTPTGTASFPFLTRPNTKFDPDGEYRVTLVLPIEDAKPLMQTIDEAMTEAFEKAKTNNPNKVKSIRMAKPPYSEVTDDEGNETGEIQLAFKMKAKITPRNGGEPFEVKPALFDAAGQSLPKSVSIGSGTKMKVCAELIPYFTDLVGAGITLRLKAVQIIELIEYNGQSADKFGFGVEDGFVYASDESPDTGVEAGFDDEADF
jgi:hypothetical protein